MFKGSIPAIITPFNKDKSIDFVKLGEHIEFLIAEGSHGLVSCGTTGESPTLSHVEHNQVTEFIIEKTNKRVPVMAGCGSNSTQESIELVEHANASNADAVLLVTPYYNRPSQDGIYEHFKKIADSIPNLPIFLYNIPGRSVVNINLETMKKLSIINNIVGVKDATSDLSLPIKTKQVCGKEFIQLSGEDATFLSFLVSGGSGCISVTANIAPKLCSDLFISWEKGDMNRATKINELLYPLNEVLFVESSPMPIKFALSLLDKCENQLRLPLVPIKNENEVKIYEVLKMLKIIS